MQRGEATLAEFGDRGAPPLSSPHFYFFQNNQQQHSIYTMAVLHGR